MDGTATTEVGDQKWSININNTLAGKNQEKRPCLRHRQRLENNVKIHPALGTAQKLVAGFSGQRPGFIPKTDYCRYALGKLALLHDFLRAVQFPSANYQSTNASFSRLSFACGTMGPFVV